MVQHPLTVRVCSRTLGSSFLTESVNNTKTAAYPRWWSLETVLVVVSLLRDGLALELLTSVHDPQVVLVSDLGRPLTRTRVGLGRGPPSGHGGALIYLAADSADNQ